MATNYIWQIDIGKQIFRLPGQGGALALFLNVNNWHMSNCGGDRLAHRQFVSHSHPARLLPGRTDGAQVSWAGGWVLPGLVLF